MKTLFFVLIAVALIGAPRTASAQETVWVQVQAVKDRAEGEGRARAYANAFQNVRGFRTDTGWYAIALGPYSRQVAEAELRALKSARLIPSDSYLAFSGQYRQQFWPGDGGRVTAIPAAPATPQPGSLGATEGDQRAALIELPDETPREARASEAALDGAARRQIQEALQWEGFYDAAIDGSFGPGTRSAMADWQAAQGHAATGILTTAQRQDLVEGYRGAFADLGLKTIRDRDAGIAITLPAGKVARSEIEAPFVRYDSTDADGVRVILISQSGDAATLAGLYAVMQTLRIVPLHGERDRSKTSFLLTGQDRNLHSYTYAAVSDGAVKGFTLIWKPDDARVMNRVAEMMRRSFAPMTGIVLPDNALPDDGRAQRIDLMAGLEIRRPERSRTGFFVDGAGSVLTTTDLLAQCRRVTIGEAIEADVAARDDRLGLALLKPGKALAPIAVAEFRERAPRINSEVTLAGFSYGDVLDLPVLTSGVLQDIRGLDGEETLDRLALASEAGDAGGPVFDASGAVLGMLRARDENGGRQLPPDVNFAIDVPAIADFLGRAGLAPTPSDRTGAMAPEDLTELAADLTVRVSCWN